MPLELQKQAEDLSTGTLFFSCPRGVSELPVWGREGGLPAGRREPQQRPPGMGTSVLLERILCRLLASKILGTSGHLRNETQEFLGCGWERLTISWPRRMKCPSCRQISKKKDLLAALKNNEVIICGGSLTFMDSRSGCQQISSGRTFVRKRRIASDFLSCFLMYSVSYIRDFVPLQIIPIPTALPLFSYFVLPSPSRLWPS
jgi:hypothetical protein